MMVCPEYYASSRGDVLPVGPYSFLDEELRATKEPLPEHRRAVVRSVSVLVDPGRIVFGLRASSAQACAIRREVAHRARLASPDSITWSPSRPRLKQFDSRTELRLKRKEPRR